ncbi:MAG: YeiH family protein [Oscillospiraceae bacterium]
MERIKQLYKGVLLCLVIAIPAWFLGQAFEVVGGPVFAILIGMVIAVFWKEKGSFTPGITFTSKKVLQYAVILLGFGLNLGTVISVGKTSLPVIVATIATSLVVSFILCKLLKIPGKISILVGVGSSICGGSAIAATAPVVEADDEEIAQSISVIFLFNIIAALIFPTLGGLLGLSNEGFALFAGTAINDTSSVTAAASSWDSMHGSGTAVLDAATIVKLTRTLAIIPITLVLALWRTRKERGGGVKLGKIFPFFILYFVAASLITTLCNYAIDLGIFSQAAAGFVTGLFAFLKKVSKFFIVMAMGAIGLNTDLVKLVKTGGKPILMGFCCWVAIAAVSLVMQHLLGIV